MGKSHLDCTDMCMHVCKTLLSILIKWNGKGIQWKYVVHLYTQDNDRGRVNPGLRKVPKLKYEYVHITSFSKMRVYLAAQA